MKPAPARQLQQRIPGTAEDIQRVASTNNIDDDLAGVQRRVGQRLDRERCAERVEDRRFRRNLVESCRDV